MTLRILGVLSVAFIVANCSSLGIAKNVEHPKNRLSPSAQLKIDSIQNWAHRYCDSVIEQVRHQLRDAQQQTADLQNRLKEQLNELSDSLKLKRVPYHIPGLGDPEEQGEGRLRNWRFWNGPDGPHFEGHGFLDHENANHDYIESDGERYYIQIVPPQKNSVSHRVGSNIWVISGEAK
jgi:hypothetical protein